MDSSTLISRLEAASTSFRTLERQLADPDVAADPKRLETIARERARLEPLVQDYASLNQIEAELEQDPSFAERGYRVSRRRLALSIAGMIIGLFVGGL
ncbi:MAG: PCRF domain-containing protein, partial [Synechococcaceae bacterium WB9_4xB_025]|nr:PCRF domain-containing protein [Synechococcaceae bacterium WB9_4xB_025]